MSEQLTPGEEIAEFIYQDHIRRSKQVDEQAESVARIHEANIRAREERNTKK